MSTSSVKSAAIEDFRPAVQQQAHSTVSKLSASHVQSWKDEVDAMSRAEQFLSALVAGENRYVQEPRLERKGKGRTLKMGEEGSSYHSESFTGAHPHVEHLLLTGDSAIALDIAASKLYT
jgi:hypothetical protein